jgi:hypothetical protein
MLMMMMISMMRRVGVSQSGVAKCSKALIESLANTVYNTNRLARQRAVAVGGLQFGDWGCAPCDTLCFMVLLI